MQKREIFTEDCVLGKKRKALKLFSTSLLGKKKKALKSFSTSLIGMAQKRGSGLAHGTPRRTGQKRPGRLASLFQTLTETAWGGAQALQGKGSLFLKTVPTMQSVPQASLQRPLS